eukprot:TRINITY_DN3174_c0_g1_i1.p2 TRINITY_DN3174_c0_g1~~TRINITY_DN3174_c0_g1_i1.p2  ORF type:complete len:79 (-),score=10.05 TRINITY_DN3174_c0_g1_i1:64-300(-)
MPEVIVKTENMISYNIKINAATTIAALKNNIKSSSGIETENMKIISKKYEGGKVEIDDIMKLSVLGIEDGDVLFMLLR